MVSDGVFSARHPDYILPHELLSNARQLGPWNRAWRDAKEHVQAPFRVSHRDACVASDVRFNLSVCPSFSLVLAVECSHVKFLQRDDYSV
jgi:hypothetical protein